MKIVILTVLLLAAGCSAPKPGKITITPRLAPTGPDDLRERTRYPELVKGYHMARYVDPNHRLLLHEAHPVYRLEAQATWNLHSPPGCFVLPTGARALTNAAFDPPAFHDSVIAELNHQKQITEAVTAEANKLTGSLQQLSQAIAQTRVMAQQNAELRQQLADALRRLESLEAELQRQKAAQAEAPADPFEPDPEQE